MFTSSEGGWNSLVVSLWEAALIPATKPSQKAKGSPSGIPQWDPILLCQTVHVRQRIFNVVRHLKIHAVRPCRLGQIGHGLIKIDQRTVWRRSRMGSCIARVEASVLETRTVRLDQS